MSEQTASSLTATTLDKVLAERGPLALAEVFPILRSLVAAVQALHTSGRIHRGITTQSIQFGGDHRVSLAPAEPVRTLGGMDRDICPPELLGSAPIELPEDLAGCRDLLQRAGEAIDPRRIDVYQLGVLLCRMLTLQPVAAYLQSPACKAGVPATVRPLLERALGYRPETRLADCQALAALLDTVARSEPVTVLPLTPPPIVADPNPTPEPRGLAGSPSAETPVDGSGCPDGRAPAPDTPAEAPLPFERLGAYRILERLGRGGMGEVYVGYEPALERRVAIKVLTPELAKSQELVARFRAEAAAMAMLSHPNIVPIYAIGEEAGRPFFVMQYIEGESLDRRLAREQRLPVDQALDLLEQCLAGLEAVHQAGLVHRDLKPGNILLEGKSGRALLADFGLVKKDAPAGSLTSPGLVLGTPDYLAPEQARGQLVDRRADLYALGVMIYQMLSGRLPFEAETLSHLIAQHAQVTARPLAQAAPAIPRPLTALVDRLLARDPAARYPSCAEVLTDLRAVRAGKPPPGLRPPRGRGARPVAWALATAAAALALLGGGIWAFWNRHVPPAGEAAAPSAGEVTAGAEPSLRGIPRTRMDAPGKSPTLPSLIQPGGSVVDPRRPAVASPAKADRLPLVIKKETRRFEARARNIKTLAFSPDGRQLLTVGYLDAVRLWDVESGKQLRSVEVKGPHVLVLAFAPDGRSAAWGDMEGQISLFDLDNLQERRSFKGHRAGIASLAFSPDGKRLLSASADYKGSLMDNTARLWEVDTGRELNRLNSGRRIMDRAAFYSDGRQVLVSSHNSRSGTPYHTVRLWDPDTGDVLPRYQSDDRDGCGLLVAAGGRRALSYGDRCLFVWEPESGRILRRIPLGPFEPWRTPSPNGLYAATCGGASEGKRILEPFIRLYDLQSAQELCRLEGPAVLLNGAAFSPDGNSLVAASVDGALLVWDLPDLPRSLPFGKGEILRLGGHTAAVTSVAFSPSSRRVVSGGLDRSVRLWDLETGEELRCILGHGDAVRSVAFTPGGRYVVSGSDDNTARLWQASTGKELRCWRHPAAVPALACSPDGRYLLTACLDNILRLWDVDSGEELQGYYGHDWPVHAVAFSGDGRWAISNGKDRVRLWDVATGQERLAGADVLNGVALGPDGFRIVCRVREPGSAMPAIRALTVDDILKEGERHPVGLIIAPTTDLAVTPDQRHVLAGIQNDLAFLELGAALGRTLKGHTARVTAVAISPDGQLAVSGSADQTVRVWGLGP